MRRWRIPAISCLAVEALQFGCDGCVPSPNPASQQAALAMPPQEASGIEKTASDAERDAAQQRAAFLSWALDRGLASPQKEANAPLYSVCSMGLIDTQFECKEGEPPPKDGLCSASYRDATGWGACMTWRLDHPSASRIEFHTRAPIPLTCEGIGATALGDPWETSDTPGGKTDWFSRICQTAGYLLEVLQFRAHYDGKLAKTVLWLTSEEYLKFDERVARLHKQNLKSAGVAE
jgi:hypothetical protein